MDSALLYVRIAYVVYHLMVKLSWTVSGFDDLLFKLGIVHCHDERYSIGLS